MPGLVVPAEPCAAQELQQSSPCSSGSPHLRLLLLAAPPYPVVMISLSEAPLLPPACIVMVLLSDIRRQNAQERSYRPGRGGGATSFQPNSAALSVLSFPKQWPFKISVPQQCE